MSVYSIKMGIRYFKEQRDKSKTQERWSHYDGELDRLERKLYELELEEEFKLRENGQTV